MPSQMFLNLPREKQENLLNEAIKEFSRVSIDEASINQIVKSANISRGSFYNYFNSKEDIFEYILSIDQKKMLESFKADLKNNNGNIFSLFMHMYNTAVKELVKKKHASFYKNALKHYRFYVNVNKNNNGKVKDLKWRAQLEQLEPFIDKKNLNCNDENEYQSLVDILIIVTIFSINTTIHGNISIDKGRDMLLSKLNMLKKGLELQGGNE